MNYTPKTEEQLIKEGLLPEGSYDFEIIDTNDQPSKKGNDMFTFKLFVFDSNGGQRVVTDYIAFGSNFGERKLRRAAVACGLIGTYDSGKLEHTDFMNASGKILLKIQDGTTEFPTPKNVVSDYLPPRDDNVTTKPTKPAREIINDDIPF